MRVFDCCANYFIWSNIDNYTSLMCKDGFITLDNKESFQVLLEMVLCYLQKYKTIKLVRDNPRRKYLVSESCGKLILFDAFKLKISDYNKIFIFVCYVKDKVFWGAYFVRKNKYSIFYLEDQLIKNYDITKNNSILDCFDLIKKELEEFIFKCKTTCSLESEISEKDEQSIFNHFETYDYGFSAIEISCSYLNSNYLTNKNIVFNFDIIKHIYNPDDENIKQKLYIKDEFEINIEDRKYFFNKIKSGSSSKYMYNIETNFKIDDINLKDFDVIIEKYKNIFLDDWFIEFQKILFYYKNILFD